MSIKKLTGNAEWGYVKELSIQQIFWKGLVKNIAIINILVLAAICVNIFSFRSFRGERLPSRC